MNHPAARPQDQSRADSASAALYAAMLIASLSYNFSFILIDYVRPFLVRTGAMSLQQTALLYSCQGFGVLAGSFLTPPLVTRRGSKMVLIASNIVLALGTALTLRPVPFELWAASRLLVGVALAGSYVSSMTLLANYFPARIRGRLLSVNMSMFSVALLMAGAIGIATGGAHWRLFLGVAAALPIVVVLLTLTFIPGEGSYTVYGSSDISEPASPNPGRWREMFVGPRRAITLCCIALAGLNFSGYQFYNGFITTYLLNERHFDAAIVGWFVVVDGVGTLLGSLLWGSIADRYGRRVVAIAFGCTTVFITLFLTLPALKPLLILIEFGYAVCLSATNCWAAYFAELFPVRLRPMGSSLYHGGHVISLAAPLIVTVIARMHSVATGMALAPITFGAAALLWWSLPETLRSARLYRGFDPDAPPHTLREKLL